MICSVAASSAPLPLYNSNNEKLFNQVLLELGRVTVAVCCKAVRLTVM